MNKSFHTFVLNPATFPTTKTMKTVVDRSVKKTKVSLPIEIVEDILSKLPVKSILRFRAVSKPWLSLISHLSFNKLQFTSAIASHRTALFISFYDHSTRKRYYLTAANNGGPLTLLMTVDEDTGDFFTGPSHLNGLVCFTSHAWTSNPFGRNSQAFVVNPSTRKIFKLPDMNSASTKYVLFSYLYGFDESRNEYKILLFRKLYATQTFEFMIYSMSSYSWRKIDMQPPVGFDWRRMSRSMYLGVFINSKVHLMLNDLSYEILAFDFVEEKFSVISLPQGALSDHLNTPSIIKIDGCLGVVFLDQGMSEVRVWLLQDYDNRVWVEETIKFPKYWNKLVGRFPLALDVNMDDEIIFPVNKVTKNLMIIPIYNRKSKCFRSVQFTLNDQLASSKTVKLRHIKCYVESIMPL